jgi:hypothetical protein
MIVQTQIFSIKCKVRFRKSFLLLVYPEAARNLALKGAEVILKPTLQGEWIGGIRNHTHIAITRAIENQCFVVSISQPSPLGMGNSVAVDPEGRIIEELGTTESFTFVYLNLNEVRRVREAGLAGMLMNVIKMELAMQNYTKHLQLLALKHLTKLKNLIKILNWC